MKDKEFIDGMTSGEQEKIGELVLKCVCVYYYVCMYACACTCTGVLYNIQCEKQSRLLER